MFNQFCLEGCCVGTTRLASLDYRNILVYHLHFVIFIRLVQQAIYVFHIAY